MRVVGLDTWCLPTADERGHLGLAAGVLMHTMIMTTIAVGFFKLAMLVLYLAFVPSEPCSGCRQHQGEPDPGPPRGRPGFGAEG